MFLAAGGRLRRPGYLPAAPGTYLPKVSKMTDFNIWTWNSHVFPGIDPLPVRLRDKVWVRMGNLTMTNHPAASPRKTIFDVGRSSGLLHGLDNADGLA